MVSFQPTSDTESLVEESSFSAVALFGFLFSLGGVFTIFRLQAIPFALIGISLGAFALFRQKRWNLSGVSSVIGFLAVSIGLFSATWGVSYQQLEKSRLVDKAKGVAAEFIGLIIDGQNEKAFRLSRSQNEILSNRTDEAAMQNAVSISKNRTAEFLAAPGIQEMIKRGTKAKWEFVTVKSFNPTADGTRIGLIYRDMNQPNSKKLLVRIIREKPRPGHPNEYSWFVPECDWDR